MYARETPMRCMVKVHAGCPTPQPSLCLRSISPQFVPPDTSRWDPGPMVLLLYETEGSVERIGYLDFRKTVRSIRDLSYNAGEFDGESGGWCSELAKSQ